MILVHDDDLAWIGGTCDSNVSEPHDNSVASLTFAISGNPPARCS